MAKSAKATKKGGQGKSNGQVDLAAEERALIDKYPDRNIVKGSIRDAGTLKEFGNKRTVEIKCNGKGENGKGCKVVRRVATSDLHQVSMCHDCIRQVRLDRRKDARATKRGKGGKAKAPKAKAPTGKKGKKAGKAPKPIRKVTTPGKGDGGPDEYLEKQLQDAEG